MRLWRLAAAGTHLYPGARLRCVDPQEGPRLAAGDDVLVEFSDGNVVPASIAQTAPGAALLAVAAHATMRGAAIAAKQWWLAPGGASGELRVRARG